MQKMSNAVDFVAHQLTSPESLERTFEEVASTQSSVSIQPARFSTLTTLRLASTSAMLTTSNPSTLMSPSESEQQSHTSTFSRTTVARSPVASHRSAITVAPFSSTSSQSTREVSGASDAQAWIRYVKALSARASFSSWATFPMRASTDAGSTKCSQTATHRSAGAKTNCMVIDKKIICDFWCQ